MPTVIIWQTPTHPRNDDVIYEQPLIRGLYRCSTNINEYYL